MLVLETARTAWSDITHVSKRTKDCKAEAKSSKCYSGPVITVRKFISLVPGFAVHSAPNGIRMPVRMLKIYGTHVKNPWYAC